MRFKACALGLIIIFLFACPVSTTLLSYKESPSNTIAKIVSGNTPGAPMPSAVDKALGIFVMECNRIFKRPPACKKALSGVTLEWSGVIAPSPSTGVLYTVVVYKGVLYSGVTVGLYIRVAWRGKISRSAFAHELGHVIGQVLLGDGDAGHTSTQLKLLETETNKKLIKEGL